MPRAELTTETMTADEAREQWADILERVKRDNSQILIERDGKPVAALISARDLEVFHLLLEQSDRDAEIVAEIQQLFAHVPDEEIERELETALAEVRAEAGERTLKPAISAL